MVLKSLHRVFAKTTRGIIKGISKVVRSRKLDDEQREELFAELVQWDLGVQTADTLLDELVEMVNEGKDVYQGLRDCLTGYLPEPADLVLDPDKINVIFVIGVNGSGKTTLTGKLAAHFKKQGIGVVLAACDTFRAAAIDQLKVWGNRAEVPVIAGEPGGDPASVAFDAVNAAVSRGAKVLIVDTAGRLHNKEHLMRELDKIKRVVSKNPQAKVVDTMLVLDATSGTNAVVQAEVFASEIGVTSLSLTKLDSSFKGGFIFSIQKKLGLPIRYIGTGEGLENIAPFNRDEFVETFVAEIENLSDESVPA